MAQAPNVQVHPISALTPFMGGRQYIRARVSDKSDIRNWNKPNGNSGSLFSCTLMDESAAIRATFFKEACNNFHSKLENGRVYIFGGMQVKNANRKFSSVDNDYEISFDGNSEVHASNEANTSIPTQRYSFVPINVLKHRPVDSRVDVLAVLKSMETPAPLQSKKNPDKPLTKQTCVVADSTGAVEITLWNEAIDKFAQYGLQPGSIVALKNVKRGDFNSVSLTWSNSEVVVNPNTPDAAALQNLYAQTGLSDVPMISEKREFTGEGRGTQHGRQWLSAIDDHGMGKNEAPDFFECVIYVSRVKLEKYYYESCAKGECKKKLTETGAGGWTCPGCGTSTATPTYRYIMQCEICDSVNCKWASMFDDTAQTFMGIKAGDFKAKLEADQTRTMKTMQSRINKPFLAKIKVSHNTYQAKDSNETRENTKIDIIKLEPMLTEQTEGEIIDQERGKKQAAALEKMRQETRFIYEYIKGFH